MEDNFLKCVPLMKYIQKKQDHNSGTLSEFQQEKFLNVMKVLHGQKTPEKEQDRKKIGKRRSEESKLKSPSSGNLRKIPIMWYHRDAVTQNFYKMPPNTVKEIHLDSKKDYSVNEELIGKENTWTINDLPSCKSLLKPGAASDENELKENDRNLFSEPSAPAPKKRKTCNELDINNLQVKILDKVPIQDLKFTDDILGKGAFGLVRRGVWSESDVAIKTIDLMQENHRDVMKEVAILRQELIFRDSVKSKFLLSASDEIRITRQMLLGIELLHAFPESIIHRDIKPANIIITSNKSVKICDLGVSKMNELNSQLMTTQGCVNIVGTPMYMAPEMFLHRQPATIYSDIWSFACTIVELFNEDHVWQLNGGGRYQLEQLLNDMQEPDLENIPKFLLEEIKDCFNYVYHLRPKAKKILQVFKLCGDKLDSD
ncbi:probable serine/threonine-protein kinase DDB_G0281745 [Trichogramma pretiosum]|uniref:probable serine/threonine-protein kinase DDB_G0281745 n=1 Tax=Trichogramma pretiosum TaxID=7493 RepID=UPI0006C9E0BE|nr:probable serine/threonine-protein kinase DDB_G0281745 [Trichogramma pretiosum]